MRYIMGAVLLITLCSFSVVSSTAWFPGGSVYVVPEPGTLALKGNGQYTFTASILDFTTHGFEPGEGVKLYACLTRSGYSDMLEELCDWSNPSDGTHSCAGSFTFNLGSYEGELELFFRIRFYWSGPSVILDESSHLSYTIVGDPDPALSLAPIELDYGEATSSQTFEVWNSGGGTLSYTISDNRPWISLSPDSGTSSGEHDTITVTVTRSGLSPSSYAGLITVDPSTGSNKSVDVTMVVPEDAPELCKSTSSLGFGSSSTSKTFDVWNCGGGTLSYAISDNKSWIRVSPSSGSSTGEHDTFAVAVDRAGLSPGSHSGTVTIDPSSGPNQSVAVSITVAEEDPELSCTTRSISFGEAVSSKTFYVSNDGGGRLEYSVSTDQAWITVSPATGGSTGERDRVTVNVARDGMRAGEHSGTVLIESNGGSHTIQVRLEVVNQGPNVPELIAPAYKDITTLRPAFRWSCSDPDGDSLRYDIFLSTSQSGLRAATNAVYLQQPQDTATAIIALDLASTQWIPPGDLAPYTTYHWSVKAKDGSELTSSAGWQFTTSRDAMPDLGTADIGDLMAATIAHYSLLPDNPGEEITLLQFLDRRIEELERGAFNASVAITITDLALTIVSAGQTHAALKGGALAAGFVATEIAKGVGTDLAFKSIDQAVASYYEGQLEAATKLRAAVALGQLPNTVGYYAALNSQAPSETVMWLQSQFVGYLVDCPGNPAFSATFALQQFSTDAGRITRDALTFFQDLGTQGILDLLGLRGSWVSKLDWEAGQAAAIALLSRLRAIAEEEKKLAGCY